MNARYYDSERGQFLGQDPVFWEVGLSRDGIVAQFNPQYQNSYSYAANNPIINKDPDGRFLDTLIDAGFIAYDLYKVGAAYYNGGDVQSELAYLSLDLAGAATPFATGFGVAARTVKLADKTGDLKKGTDFGKLGKVADQEITQVTGYTKHGLDQKITRKVSTSNVVNTVRNPGVVLKQSGGNSLHVTKESAVVVNNQGRVVTTYSSREYNKQLRSIEKQINNIQKEINKLTKQNNKRNGSRK